MKPAIIDTDTLSYFFRSHPKVVEKLDRYLTEYGFVHISIITYYEVLNGLYFKDAKQQLKKFEDFVLLNEVIPLTDNIAKRAAKIYADLRKAGKTIGHNDVLIASTAIENDFTLITNNIKDFERIDGVDFDNWTK